MPDLVEEYRCFEIINLMSETSPHRIGSPVAPKSGV